MRHAGTVLKDNSAPQSMKLDIISSSGYLLKIQHTFFFSPHRIIEGLEQRFVYNLTRK